MTQINSNFAGQNAWMHPIDVPGHEFGSCGDYWNDVEESGAKFIRIGGKTYDKYLKTANSFTPFRDSQMFTHGFTPIFQLSYYDPDSPDPESPTIYTNPAKAARHLLKNVVKPLYKNGVRHFLVGNEPNLEYSGQSDARGISAYISEIAQKIKEKYPDVVLYGPELTHYDDILIDKLTGVNQDSGDCNILPYIDVFTFHYYPFGDQSATGRFDQIEPTKDNIINVLRVPVAYPDDPNDPNDPLEMSVPLEERLIHLNGTIQSYNLANDTTKTMGVTEANVCYKNNPANDGDDSYGTNGFMAGQLWAEMMAVCMSQSVFTVIFWSVIEGTGNDGSEYSTDIGYISSQTEGRRKSTYYHFKMVANYFKGDFAWAEITNATGNIIKAFASNYNNEKIAIIVMNQNDVVGAVDIEIRFDSLNFQNTDYVGIRVNFDINNDTYTDLINEQETLLLLFNRSGLNQRYSYNKNDYSSDVDPFSAVPN